MLLVMVWNSYCIINEESKKDWKQGFCIHLGRRKLNNDSKGVFYFMELRNSYISRKHRNIIDGGTFYLYDLHLLNLSEKQDKGREKQKSKNKEPLIRRRWNPRV